MATAGRSTSSTTTILVLLYLTSVPSSFSVVTSPAYQGEEQDRWALLQFKNALSSSDLFHRWSPDSGGRHCSWPGVTCDARSRVVSLSVPSRPGRRLVGEMSPGVARLTELKSLSFPAHGLHGEIPGEIWQLQRLELVNLAGNSLHGALPATFPLRLQKLDLSGNQFSGSIPPGIGSCVWLRSLRLSSNSLDGSIPQQVRKLTKLQVLDLSRNRLSGPVPPELGHCRGLVKVDLSRNFLHGRVPSRLKELKSLRILSLAWNNISGPIPSGLGQLRSLEVLDLSSNSLSGVIPIDLVALKSHTVLLLGNNELSGDVPASAPESSLSLFNVSSVTCGSIRGNPSLQPCELFRVSTLLTNARALTEVNTNTPPDVTPTDGGGSGGGLRSLEIAVITSASAIIAILLAVVILYICTRKCTSRQSRRSSRRKEVTVFVDIGAPLTYETVVRATGNFNASNCIGSGGFGATYKAEIAPGVLVAIKKLSVGRFQGAQQFQAEVKTLGRCRHPNLVTLIGFHLSDSEMFLIYNYLPGGNLERFIEERTKRPIDWRMLHKIALDVARALAYMHDDSVPRILHRDVKPSNILLDNEHNAYLSDFGLARLLGNSETHATTGVAGTFGYVAPEYAMTCRVSDKADVYSYGIVLLELISDKKALDPSFSPYGNGFNIVAWACMLLQKGRAREFFIEGLWDVAPHDDLVKILHLGIKCTVDSLSYRPTMKHVVRHLRGLRPPAY